MEGCQERGTGNDPIFFCTPVHSSAQGMIAGTDNDPFRASHHSTLARGERARPCLPGFVAASVFSTLACLCANLFMGCRCFWKGKCAGRGKAKILLFYSHSKI
jgi:hypothetical protein